MDTIRYRDIRSVEASESLDNRSVGTPWWIASMPCTMVSSGICASSRGRGDPGLHWLSRFTSAPRMEGRQWLRWLRGVCIGIFVTGGMLLAAYGWNSRSGHLRDRAMLAAVAHELDLNQICIELLSLAHQEYEVTGNPDAMTALLLLYKL